MRIFGAWKLDPWTLAYALIPLFVIAFSLQMAAIFGMPDPPSTLHPVPNVYLEAAARLRMLATWIALAILAAGSIAFFLRDLRNFDKSSFGWLLGVFLIAASLMSLRSFADPAFGRAEHAIGERTICMAFGGKAPTQQGLAKPQGLGNPAAKATVTNQAVPSGAGSSDLKRLEPGPPKPVVAAHPAPPKRHWLARLGAPECTGVDKFVWLQQLNSYQLYLLLLVLPAMVLGAISTLASGAATGRDQGMRLKTYLYLSATLLVSGLLYLSALLRWPGSALVGKEAADYTAFVDAYLLCLGVAYSLFIISYYLPVAARLSRNEGSVVVAVAARDKIATKNGQDDVLRPLDILKVMLAMFAPLITALLGNVIKL